MPLSLVSVCTALGPSQAQEILLAAKVAQLPVGTAVMLPPGNVGSHPAWLVRWFSATAVNCPLHTCLKWLKAKPRARAACY